MIVWIIFALILLASWNASQMAFGKKPPKWTVVMYWLVVAAYWFLKAAEIGG